MTVEDARALCLEAHKGQWRRPMLLPKGPGGLITDKLMSTMMYNGLSESPILQDGNKLTYCSILKQWHLVRPYHTHPLAVAEMMDTEEEKIVALLHDVIEDCDGWGLSEVNSDEGDMYAIHFTPYHDGGYFEQQSWYITYNIYRALDLLVHEKHIPYETYIEEITTKQFISGLIDLRANEIATKIKIADITCNLLDNPTDRQKKKYSKAIPILLKSI